MFFIALMAVWLLGTGVGFAANPEFYAHWADGKAELSSYKVFQPRYGELREGYAVLVFVTEDINRNTFIKVESPAPREDRIYTLKLNNVLKFKTGIYDYSVMTSVFSAVEGQEGDKPFELSKITLSAQEWCGHVFEEVQVRQGRLRGTLNSYFEREGRQTYELPLPRKFASEDHLLIRIRELKGPIMAEGEQKEVMLLPSLWYLRAQHASRELVEARLSKGYAVQIPVGEQALEAIPWKWELEGRHKTVWVEKIHPHRILAWEDSQGGRGELLETLREPYWRLQRTADEVFRERLGIP